MRAKCLIAAFTRRSALPGFMNDRRGVVAIEFALVGPIALLLLFGEYTLCDAMSARRKITIAGHTIADLVARQSSVTSTSMSTIMNAAAQIAAPYQTSNMTIVVSELTTNSSGQTSVTWSTALNAAPMTMGAKFSLPAGLAQNNTSLIYSIASYSYTPMIGQSLFGTMTFNSLFYMNPRITSSVTYSN